MSEPSDIRIEPATLADLPALAEMLRDLSAHDIDYRPNKEKQMRGLRLIVEQPSRGRVFVIRNDYKIIGMINLLFTINTAEGGFVVLLEDLVIHQEHRGQGYGSQLFSYALNFAKEKQFLRITLLTAQLDQKTSAFFERYGFSKTELIPMRLILNSTPDNELNHF